MLTLLAVVHIFIGLMLVVFVLLQDPKGGAMGVFSGGSSSSSFFGSSGASNFLTTITKWLAVAFAVSCITLYVAAQNRGGSVFDADDAAPVSNPAVEPSPTPAPNQQSIPGTSPALDTPTTETPKQ